MRSERLSLLVERMSLLSGEADELFSPLASNMASSLSRSLSSWLTLAFLLLRTLGPAGCFFTIGFTAFFVGGMISISESVS